MYKNLKALRQSLNMTQKEFAASLGIGYTTYNGYETGAREPKSDFWIAVAQKYRVTIDYLMGYSDDPQKTSTCCADIAALDKELKEFVTEIIREIGFPRGADSQTTITEAKHVFLRVAEIYGEKPAILGIVYPSVRGCACSPCAARISRLTCEWLCVIVHRLKGKNKGQKGQAGE